MAKQETTVKQEVSRVETKTQKKTALWDVKHYVLLDVNRRFGEVYCLSFQRRMVSQESLLGLNNDVSEEDTVFREGR
jgi:hypothetical protein